MAAKMPITADREEAFLRGYIASGGSFSDACRCASPHIKKTSRHPPAHQTWRNHLKDDLRFAERFEEAKREVADNLVKIVNERIKHGTRRPLLYKGVQGVDHEGNPAWDVKFPDHLLLARLRSLLPEFRETTEVNIHVRGHWTLSAADLESLNDDQLRIFTSLLGVIRENRKQTPTAELIEHQADPDAELAEWNEAAHA